MKGFSPSPQFDKRRRKKGKKWKKEMRNGRIWKKKRKLLSFLGKGYMNAARTGPPSPFPPPFFSNPALPPLFVYAPSFLPLFSYAPGRKVPLVFPPV